MALDLQELGITSEDLIDRVVDRMCEQLMKTSGMDDEGNEYSRSSSLRGRLDAQIKEQIDAAVKNLAETHVKPNVIAHIESLKITKTNTWGEKQKEPFSFIEYLIDRAEKWMTEEVNYDGKTKAVADSYSWKGAQTRVSWMIEKHLQYAVETAMKQALANANATLVKGLEETAKIQLADIAKRLKVEVVTK